jgi:hypothetical protein
MGPKQIPVRTSITPEVKTISTSQEAPTLRPTPQRHAPRGRANTSKEETTTTKSLSPELTATKKRKPPKPRAYGYEEPKKTTIMKEEKPDREQIATVANSPYNSMVNSPYVPVGSLRQHHEAQKTKHASSRNQIDLLHISTIQEHDNMSKPVTTQRLLSRGSTSNEDRDDGNAIPDVSATPKDTTTKISTPQSGPDPEHITMAELQAILKTTPRDNTDDLRKQHQTVNEEQTDAVKNLKTQFNKQTVTSKKAKESKDPEQSKGQNEQPVKSQKAKVKEKPDKTTGSKVKNEPEKTTGQTNQRPIHSTRVRINESCETETMATQTKRNKPSRDKEMCNVHEERILPRGSPSHDDHDGGEKPATTGPAPVQINIAQLQAMMATTARDITTDLTEQQQTAIKLQKVAMHKLQQQPDKEPTLQKVASQQQHQQAMQQQQVVHDEVSKIYKDMQELQQRFERLKQTRK